MATEDYVRNNLDTTWLDKVGREGGREGGGVCVSVLMATVDYVRNNLDTT